MVDLTGLKGSYDFDLSWTPRGALPKPVNKAGDMGQTPLEAPAPAGNVTVFEAIDKQLGLELKEQKHPMPVLVIDHVARTPSDN